jgi:hypothetical protein
VRDPKTLVAESKTIASKAKRFVPNLPVVAPKAKTLARKLPTLERKAKRVALKPSAPGADKIKSPRMFIMGAERTSPSREPPWMPSERFATPKLLPAPVVMSSAQVGETFPAGLC